jgi:hypothetical protein
LYSTEPFSMSCFRQKDGTLWNFPLISFDFNFS